MNTRLRIVRPGSETMTVASPGASDDAGMMRGVVVARPVALGERGR